MTKKVSAPRKFRCLRGHAVTQSRNGYVSVFCPACSTSVYEVRKRERTEKKK